MPLPDAGFDRVLSTFGHAFAADHEGAANELVRLCRPGGTIAAAMWTPEGANGRMFGTVGKHMPAPPPGFRPPILWGTEAHWEQLVGSPGRRARVPPRAARVRAPDAEQYVADFEAWFGPLVVARRMLGDGFAALHDDLVALFAEYNTATDGGMRVEAEYLVAVGRKPA